MRGRPKKTRMVAREPDIRQFSPRGRIGRPGYIELKTEEFEALKRADFMGQKQVEAAADMHISQQTFSRVLRNGRKCLAEALIKGHIIKIQGGAYKVAK
jgi:predicted DNA-binding protein (UPF0251 family)